MHRKIIAATATAALMLLAAPQSASAVKPPSNCPSAFDLGALTVGQGLQLPNIQAGLLAGVYDEESLIAFFEYLDRNEDGLLCFKSTPSNANDASQSQYNYNIVENNASVPSG